VPTTYIWGRHDVALARAAAELTANYVAGPYEVVELDAGHWLRETEPDAVTDGILARDTGKLAQVRHRARLRIAHGSLCPDVYRASQPTLHPA
jgi:hypothetical protein